MEILKREQTHLGGFAGLRENRLITDACVFGPPRGGAWPKGIGSFVYLADAKFQPHGDTRMHPHREIDIISFMVEGRLRHEGSLGEGSMLLGRDVQIQRAGAKGLVHNEINPDDQWNRMLQLWVLPDEDGKATDYQIITPKPEELTPVYGSMKGEGATTLDSKTQIFSGIFKEGTSFKVEGDFLCYLIQGVGILNGERVIEGDLVRGENLDFTGSAEGYLFVVQASA